jgi:hypothetical protein
LSKLLNARMMPVIWNRPGWAGMEWCMRRFLAVALTAPLLAMGMLVTSAAAEEVISVVWRKAQFLTLKGEPASIVIGDPSVTDVSIEGPGQILIFGKVPGETSLMIMDANGTMLMDAAVVVAPETSRHVSIISPSESAVEERTWNCYVRCVQVIGPGSIAYKAPKRGSSSGGAAAPAGATPDMTGAAEQTAGGVSDMNQGVAGGAKSAAGQSNLMMTP